MLFWDLFFPLKNPNGDFPTAPFTVPSCIHHGKNTRRVGLWLRTERWSSRCQLSGEASPKFVPSWEITSHILKIPDKTPPHHHILTLKINPPSKIYQWMFPKIGVFPPKWMVKIMENPIKMDDLGVPLFSETSSWERRN